MSSTPPEGYEAYPRGNETTYGSPRGDMPGSVATAVKLIWVSMGLAVIGSLLTFTMLDTIVDRAIENASAGKTVDRDVVRNSAIAGAIIGLVIGLGLTYLMLHFIRKGANWARILYTVLGALGIITGVLGFGGDQPPLLLVLSLVSLVLTATILFFLWKGESNPWFAKRTA
jgi:mannose/fructose/N-acetylgalactosamine-specific phosphotransferase system component IID